MKEQTATTTGNFRPTPRLFSELRTEVEQTLRVCLRELCQNTSLRALPVLSEAVSEFISGGGHRIRPLLFLLAWLGYGKEINQEILRVSAAIELFHNFALMHDDIIDRSDLRRGKPSLHVLLAKKMGLNDQAGQELALLTGDIIYSAAVRAILAVEAHAGHKVQVLEELMRVAIDTGAGACLEVINRQHQPQDVNEETVDLVRNLKTSQYTFVGPLLLAAILSSAAPGEREVLSRFGSLAGQAYQMQDDLNDMQSYLSDPTSMQPCEARHLWPFWQACQNVGDAERESLNVAILAAPADVAALKTIQRILAQHGVFRQGEIRISSLLQAAEKTLNSSLMDIEYRNILWQCLRGFFDNTAAPSEATP